MEKLKLKLNDFRRALSTLDDILNEPYSVIVRDAAIQRFEYTFESLWKCVKIYLYVKEGIIANSPKTCFRELFSTGILTEEETETCLNMTDRRNDTSHTYIEKLAEIIFKEIPDYFKIIKKISDTIHKEI